ncbi:MAG: lipoate--protein ligase [Lachnospiraceae bacterium]|nr:lipoate--protein ligase [Lachnospiraceae bacterium]
MERFGCFDLDTTDPAWNLAAEQYVFDELPRDRSYLMLWQNDNAVIVGKYQNTSAEINAAYIEKKQIRVVRRLSGGGAVYHDLGNLNFTIITDAAASEAVNLRLFCEPVVRTLASFGVKAEIDGRNDITVDGKKFSGNAQYRRNGRVMHHGTILFDSDLETVRKALKVSAEKIRSKGIASVRSRVTNLKQFLPPETTLADFKAALIREVSGNGGAERLYFSDVDRARIEAIREARYALREWNYGASPSCTLLKQGRIEGCGSLQIYLTTEKDRITDLHLLGDFFAAQDPTVLEKALIGVSPEREACEKALQAAAIRTEDVILGLHQKDFLDLLC